MSRLRLSLTIPGAVSLGAYEGGALAALIVAAKTLGEETILIDSIAAASAGSITALLTARSLLRSVDPVNLLKAAWVENVSFQAMKTDSTDAPLSSGALTEMATKVLGPGGIPEGEQTTGKRSRCGSRWR
jgi:predicted acylesterase/phospholipase RssA